MADLFYPVAARVVEWPGPRGDNYHYGTDFAANRGDPVYASFDGVVVFAGGDGAFGELYPGSGIWANGQGLTVDIQRADGLISRVGHMSHINVRVGQRVTACKTVLGGAGDSGFSLGVHCHWELRWDRAWSGGAWVDPRKLNAQPLEDEVDAAQEERIAKKAGKYAAQYILAAKVKTNRGGTNSLRLFLSREDNRFAWIKARLGKK